MPSDNQRDLIGLLDRRQHPGSRARDRFIRLWGTTLARLTRLGGLSDHNRVTLYTDGDDAFAAMLAAMEKAQKRVWLETYIYEPDRLGHKVLDALVAARQRGADVVLIVDDIGSGTAPEKFFAPLREAGGEVLRFNPARLFRRPRGGRVTSRLTRDHRKILIVDDDIGFTGGMNVSEDYAGEKLGNGRFRDTHMCLQGPGVRDLMDIFMESAQDADDRVALDPRRGPDGRPGAVMVQVLRSNVVRGRLHIQRALRQVIQRSVVRCYLTSPYFLPPKRLMKAMMRAARRGVDVRVLTAGVSDVPIMHAASQAVYRPLLKAGVRLFEYHARTLHAKTAVVDAVYASVGSFNLDYWSARRNHEVNVAILHVDVAESLEQQFSVDVAGAVEITLDEVKRRTLWQRFVSWCAYQLARL